MTGEGSINPKFCLSCPTIGGDKTDFIHRCVKKIHYMVESVKLPSSIKQSKVPCPENTLFTGGNKQINDPTRHLSVSC